MEINFKELQEQRRERILKKGEYARFEIIVEKGDRDVTSILEVKDLDSEELALFIHSIKDMSERLLKNYPELEDLMEEIETTIIKEEVEEEREIYE